MRNSHLKTIFLLSLTSLLCACNSKSLSNLTSQGTKHFSDIQEKYLKSDNIADTSPYNGNMSLSIPEPTVLSWKGKGIKEYKIKLYKDESLTNLAASYVTKETSFNFYNEELFTKYYWTVEDNNGSLVSEKSSFYNKIDVAGPRNLNVEGVENFRDLGGWGYFDDSGYHRYIKQGMIYRSGRFNEDKKTEVTVSISDNGLQEVKNHLKIKTEIDLRRSSNNEIGGLTKSVLGDDVNYYNFPMYYGGYNILTYKGQVSGDTYEYDNPAAFKQVFDILADEKNYPIDFHCSIGKDRTGCLAYLIEGLLGFDQELMYRDYMFTNFANAGMCKLTDITNEEKYGTTLDNYTGDTLKDKVFNYLHNEIGVEEEKLNKIINLLKEDKTDTL